MPFTFSCSKCGKEIKFKSREKGTTARCWQCGTLNVIPENAVEESPGKEIPSIPNHHVSMVETRYTALRIISTGYKVFAYIIGIGGTLLVLLGGAGMAKFSPAGATFLPVIAGLVVVGIASFTMFAASEGIKIFIDIEENTRLAALRLRRLETFLPVKPDSKESVK